MMKIILLLCLFGLLKAQSDENPVVNRPNSRITHINIKRHHIPLRYPVQSDFVVNLGDRARENLGQLRDATNIKISRLRSVLSGVRNRSEEYAKRALDDIKSMRTQVIEILDRLKIIMKEKEELEEKKKALIQKFEQRREKFTNEMMREKDVIEIEMKSSGNEPNERLELEEESNRLDVKLNKTLTEPLLPQTRGLGDGYGRIL